MPPKQQTLAGFFGGAAGVKRTVEEEKPVEADENALSVQNSKSSSEVKRTEAATEDDIIAQGDAKRMKTTTLASTNDAKIERASADAVKSPLRDVTAKAETRAADSTKPADDGNDDEEIVVSTRRRGKASSRALEDDYEDEDEIDSDEEDSEIEDDIEDVEVGAPKTGKMPKAKKAKKAKKEEAATAGVGD